MYNLDVWHRDAGEMMRRTTYVPPSEIHAVRASALLEGVRSVPPSQRARLGLPGLGTDGVEMQVYYAGDSSLVRLKGVAVVGSRGVSDAGAARARRLARGLAEAGVVVVSGLAKGVDVCAHQASIEAGGRTIAVIGTPIDKAYPAEHAKLQERIYREHLLISPFVVGSQVFKSNFPQRNKLMAAISDATVIVEASDTSGSLHQAAECARIGRPLFIAKSVAEDSRLQWPKSFLTKPGAHVLESVEQLVAFIQRGG